LIALLFVRTNACGCKPISRAARDAGSASPFQNIDVHAVYATDIDGNGRHAIVVTTTSSLPSTTPDSASHEAMR
jgi:hypothetical protein